MPKFYYNNSSIPYLACSKRYQFQVVRGLRPPPGGNKYIGTGLAGHKMLQLVGSEQFPNWQMAMMFGDKTKLPASIAAVPEAVKLKLAMLVDRIYAENPGLFDGAVREFKFEYDDSDTAAIYCGTIDLLTYDAATDTVIITDWKFTSKPIDSWLVNSYTLTSQRWFYLQALYNIEDQLPAPWRNAVTHDRIAFRYCFVGVDSDSYLLQQPALVDIEQLNTFGRLFNDKAVLADAIHDDPNLAVKEGILTGQCWKCPYNSLCLASDEEQAVQKWPYGSKPYTHNHEEE